MISYMTTYQLITQLEIDRRFAEKIKESIKNKGYENQIVIETLISGLEHKVYMTSTTKSYEELLDLYRETIRTQEGIASACAYFYDECGEGVFLEMLYDNALLRAPIEKDKMLLEAVVIRTYTGGTFIYLISDYFTEESLEYILFDNLQKTQTHLGNLAPITFLN